MPTAKASWGGHKLIDPKHSERLELAAAVHEFHAGHDRKTAEKMALDEYRREHHARGAAHHLQSLKAASASGATDDAKRHYEMYRLHIKALGHQPNDPVPTEVRRYAEGEGAEKAYRYKAHPSDDFLVS
jgi:hypothetical protein